MRSEKNVDGVGTHDHAVEAADAGGVTTVAREWIPSAEDSKYGVSCKSCLWPLDLDQANSFHCFLLSSERLCSRDCTLEQVEVVDMSTLRGHGQILLR